MRPRGPIRLQLVTASASLIASLAPAGAARGSDCNGNGIPDESELKPRALASVPPFARDVNSLLAGDLDGDGDVDLVASGNLLFNEGGPDFCGANWKRLQEDARAQHLADLDGDGDPDLAGADELHARIMVLENQGGDFAVRPVPIGAPASSVTTADLDRDGDLDLIAASVSTGDMAVVLQEAPGAFTLRHQLAGPVSLAVQAAVDFDGDGDADPVAIHAGPGRAVPWRSEGDGSLAPTRAIPLRGQPSFETPADVDGDGDSDLVIADRLSRRIFVLKARVGGFARPVVVDSRLRGTGWLAAGDLDADGTVDLVAAGEGWSRLLGNGRGRFRVERRSGDSFRAAALADLDGDGLLDVALARGTSWVPLTAITAGEMVILYNQGAGRPGLEATVPLSRAAHPGVHFLSPADLDGDGDQDLVLGSSGGRLLRLRFGAGPTWRRLPDITVPDHARAVAAGDFAGDAAPDLLVLGTEALHLIARSRRTTLRDPPSGPLAIADLDGDGDADVAGVDPFRIALLWNQGGGSFDRERILVGSSPALVAALDLDADADPDLVTVNDLEAAGQLDNLSVFRNDGGRQFRPAGNFALGIDPRALAVADFDGDGLLDLAVSFPAIRQVALLRNHGRGGFHPPETMPHVLDGRRLFAVDFEGDGDADLLAATNPSFENPASLALARNAGDGSFQNPMWLAYHAEPECLAVLDLDGDGDAELAAWKNGLSLLDFYRPPAVPDRNRDGLPDECQGLPFRRGDANADGRVDAADPVAVLRFLFRSGSGLACADAGDVEDSGRLDLADAIYLLAYLFGGGPSPAAPGPGVCAPDAGASLGCDSGGC